jgi:hypothetical protein
LKQENRSRVEEQVENQVEGEVKIKKRLAETPTYDMRKDQ